MRSDIRSARLTTQTLCTLHPSQYLAGAARCLYNSGYGDKAVEALRSAREVLEEAKSPSEEEVREVDSAWRLIFPFDGFPDELIAEILDHLYSSVPLPYPLIATQICSSWRRLALRQSSLWRDTSIFPLSTEGAYLPRTERSLAGCKEGSERFPAIVRLCDERSCHSLRTIKMPIESCTTGFEKVLKLAWASRHSLINFEISDQMFAVCTCTRGLAFDHHGHLNEVLERQLQFVAAAPLLDTVSLYLYPLRGTQERLAFFGRQMQDRQKAPSVVRLTLPCTSEEDLSVIEILKPLLVSARALAIDADSPMSMAASWKAAFYCSQTVEKLELPLVLSSRDLRLLDGALESACQFPSLNELILKSEGQGTRELRTIPAPAHPLYIPTLRTIDMDVRALTTFKIPFLKAARLHVLCPEDVSILESCVRTWEHLEYLAIDIREVFRGGALMTRKTVEVLCTALADSSQTAPACPKLSRIHLTCRPASNIWERPEVYIRKLPSCSREQWEALPPLDSSLFRLEEKRRKLCQASDDPKTARSTLAQASGAFQRGIQLLQAQAPEPEPEASLCSPDYVPFDQIILEGWYVDPNLWSAFKASSPCEVTCLPDPSVMDKKLYSAPKKPAKGEKRIYAW